jgi:uncharacterized protein YndB with AHSA1/START domain
VVAPDHALERTILRPRWKRPLGSDVRHHHRLVQQEAFRMEGSTTRPQVMRTQRTVPYAPDEVYTAFSDPARLAKWWGPRDFTNTFEIFEFRAGGIWRYVMHGPDGSNYHNESVFMGLEPGRKIVMQHVSPPHFTLTVSLSPTEAGTQVLWVQEFEDPGVAAAIRHIAEPGNEQNLDRLQMHLRGELK